jgi:hypothetical protein
MTAKEIHYRQHISINIGHRTDELMGFIYLRTPRFYIR